MMILFPSHDQEVHKEARYLPLIALL